MFVSIQTLTATGQHVTRVYLNAAGVQNKKHELIQFLLDEDVDIMLIRETWLKVCYPKLHSIKNQSNLWI